MGRNAKRFRQSNRVRSVCLIVFADLCERNIPVIRTVNHGEITVRNLVRYCRYPVRVVVNLAVHREGSLRRLADNRPKLAACLCQCGYVAYPLRNTIAYEIVGQHRTHIIRYARKFLVRL